MDENDSQGRVGPMKSRPDYPDAVRRIREIEREAEEAGYEINPAIRLNLQVHQRPGQQFQQSGKLAAWTVDPKTGRVWWPSAESSSSTTWWSSTEWKES